MGGDRSVGDSVGDVTEILPDTGTRVMHGNTVGETTAMPVAGDGGSRPVPPAIPPKGTTPDDGNDETRAPTPRRRRSIIIASSIIAVLVLAGLAGGYAYADMNANRGMRAAQANAQTVDKQLGEKIGEARKLADATDAGMVDDPGVLESLASTIAKASKRQGVKTVDANPYMLWTLTAAQSGYDRDARDAKTAVNELGDAIDAVDDSAAAKTLKDAKNALRSTVDAADKTYTDTDGKVQDDATRDALKQAIDAAKKTLSDRNVTDAKAYTDQKGKVDAAVTAVNDSKAAKDKADAEAAAQAAVQAAAAQASQSTGGSYSGSNSYNGYTGSGSTSSGGSSYNGGSAASNNGSTGSGTVTPHLTPDSMGNQFTPLEGNGWGMQIF